MLQQPELRTHRGRCKGLREGHQTPFPQAPDYPELQQAAAEQPMGATQPAWEDTVPWVALGMGLLPIA